MGNETTGMAFVVGLVIIILLFFAGSMYSKSTHKLLLIVLALCLFFLYFKRDKIRQLGRSYNS
jgi:hypothetical protein